MILGKRTLYDVHFEQDRPNMEDELKKDVGDTGRFVSHCRFIKASDKGPVYLWILKA